MLTSKMPPASGGVLATMLIHFQQPLTLVGDDASIRQGMASSARVLNVQVQKNYSGGC